MMKPEQMRSAAEECLELYRACGDQYGEIDGLLLLAHYWRVLANNTQAAELGQQALTLSRSLGDLHRKAQALSRLGYDDLDLKRGLTYLEQAISLFRQLQDWLGLASSLSSAGDKTMLNGDLQVAEEYAKESIVLFRQLKLKSGLVVTLQTYGRILCWRGDYEGAHPVLLESIEISHDLGNRSGYLWSSTHLGYLTLYQGNVAEARRIFIETTRDFFNDKSEIGVVFTLEGMASLSVEVGKPKIAAQLIGWADATRKRMDNTRPRLEQADVDKIITACLAKMGKVAFSEAYDEGQKMTLEEAVVLALNKH